MESVRHNMSQWSTLISTSGDAHEHEPFLDAELSMEMPRSSGSQSGPTSRTSEGILGNVSEKGAKFSRLRGLLSIATLLSFLRYLIPSFLTKSASNSKPVKILPTTYLNGVRGFAACFVFTQHLLVISFKWLDNGYLSSPTNNQFLQLPIIRVFFTGRFMVTNFFILSGFVLSIKPLKLARKRDLAFADCLAGALFRRAPRLFLPLMPPMFVSAIINYMYWLWPGPNMPPYNPNHKYPSLSDRFKEEYNDFTALINPSTWGELHPRNTPHMWTIPIEFRGSLIVFLGVLMFAKAKTAVRLIALSVFAGYCEGTGRWDVFLFVCGIIMAEIHLIKQEAGVDDILEYLSNENETVKRMAPVFWSITFATALFFGSWPRYAADKTPGYRMLQSLTPTSYEGEEAVSYFWFSTGAVLMIMSLENFKVLQTPFGSALGRYLGDISYAFYIVHWTIIWTIGRVITVGMTSLFGLYLGWFVGALISFLLTVVVGDVYWRAIDNRAVNFSRWLWIKCSASD